jgi:hypothetical protein
MTRILPDVEYQPEMAVCPVCRQRVMVTHHMTGLDGSRWAGIATHLYVGSWCGQHEVFIGPVGEPE